MLSSAAALRKSLLNHIPMYLLEYFRNRFSLLINRSGVAMYSSIIRRTTSASWVVILHRLQIHMSVPGGDVSEETTWTLPSFGTLEQREDREPETVLCSFLSRRSCHLFMSKDTTSFAATVASKIVTRTIRHASAISSKLMTLSCCTLSTATRDRARTTMAPHMLVRGGDGDLETVGPAGLA